MEYSDIPRQPTFDRSQMFRTLSETSTSDYGVFDVLKTFIDAIKVGDAYYRFRHQLTVEFYPLMDGMRGELLVSPNVLDITGIGYSMRAAQQDWNETFHARFQSLLAKRHWERDEADERDWAMIEQFVDVPAYKRETPVRVRQVGTVTRNRLAEHGFRPLPTQVRWDSGRVEDIQLDFAPLDFSTYPPGSRVEAVVLRNPTTNCLIRILDSVRLKGVTHAECESLWSKVAGTSEFEKVEWEALK